MLTIWISWVTSMSLKEKNIFHKFFRNLLAKMGILNSTFSTNIALGHTTTTCHLVTSRHFNESDSTSWTFSNDSFI